MANFLKIFTDVLRIPDSWEFTVQPLLITVRGLGSLVIYAPQHPSTAYMRELYFF
jgi:hypothetical protein